MLRLTATTRLVVAGVACLIAAIATAAPAVLQRGYTPGVINANTAESILTTTNVTEATFGRIFSLPVDGRIYAQPLYVPGVSIPNQGTHNVLYVATMNDSVFAFDADTPGAPLWSVDYATLVGAVPVPIVKFVGTDSLNIAGTVGIESTPVIDSTTQTMYFVTNTLESGNVVFRLHAIDITTGAEKFGGPVVISGSFTAGGKTITFNPGVENQRVSLTIAKNQVIVGFGSHEDANAYYGWLMAYDKTSLAQTGIFNPVPTDDHGGAFWQSGRPPVVDASGYVYVFVGNAFLASGSNSTWDGINNFTESALKLDPGQGLKLIDYFTPANFQTLDDNDQDLSSSGAMLIPGTNTLLGGGKDGVIYLLNTQNMGHLQANDAGAVQSFPGAAGEIRGGFAYWTRSTAAGGPLAFNWAANDALKEFSFNGTVLATAPVAQFTPPINLYPGGELTLSSNGDAQGIVWALINGQGDADHRVPPGILVAVNATTLSQLWSSTANAARDDFGLLAKWVPPLVVNGKVYVATSSNQVVAYGELPASGTTVTAWPSSQADLGGTATVVVNALSAAGAAQAATWSVSGLPAGASGSFVTDSQGQTVLQVTAGASTAAGSYPLLVTATVNGTQTVQPVYVNIGPSSLSPVAVAKADSSASTNPPSYAIDGNSATFWSTQTVSPIPGYPHEITLDLGAVQSINGLSYLTRQDDCSNGMILQYEVHLSVDGSTYSEVTGGSFDYGPSWHTFNCSGPSFLLPKRQSVSFPTTSARYVELVALGSVTDTDPWATAAEVQVFQASYSASAGSQIVPYIAVNNTWITTPTASVSVTSGTSVNLGPQPLSGGSWSWAGPNGFSSTAREIDNIPLSVGTNTYVATYTNSTGAVSTQTFTITVTSSTAQPTPIVPYLSVNGGAVTQTAAVTVNSGATVDLIPTPATGGSWSWTGPSGFTSTAREIDNIPLTVGINNYVATYTNSAGAISTQIFTITVTSSTTPATPIVPYIGVNGSWTQTATASVVSGAAVDLGPQPVSGGSWSWTSANGFTSISREIDNIPLSVGTNTYVATYTNSAGAISTQTFTITVTSSTAQPTPIVPYLSVNGGAVTQTAAVTVSSGSTVNLIPTPATGGSWSWTGPNGFTSTAREIDDIPLTVGINNYVATYTNSAGAISTQTFTITVTSSTTQPTPIVPYIAVNGAWTQTATASVVSGTAVDIGPQPLSGGSWSWAGPNGFTSTAREIDNIPLSVGTNTYVATYTNSTGAVSTQTFTITVTSSTAPTGTPIVPYLSVNGGAVTQTATATVSSGSIVDLIPTPSTGGSWSWTGPGGFTSTSREIDNIPLSVGTNTYIANFTNSAGAISTQTFTITVTSSATQPTPIVPYIAVNGAWTKTATASVVSGAAVDIGPQPLTGGSWSWTGPNGFTSTAREIDNIPLGMGANTYVATYTNSAGGISTQTFTITLN
jgi:hypothetical protein